jgi:hypothetical protein
MPTHHLETDYLVIGAGAASMAFVDTLLTHSDGHVVMVDEHDRPGGHWNHAYPFVRLHQPSAYYGVESRELGRNERDGAGINAGMQDLASGAEVLDYFSQVMRQRFLASGRVTFLRLHRAVETAPRSAIATCLLTGAETQIVARRKLVDGTLAKSRVPSTHPPKYTRADGVRCIPLNDLPAVKDTPSGYVVVGAGKTGIDACLWLLDHGVSPERIRWIMPREAWWLDRANVQTFAEDFERTIPAVTTQLEAIRDAESVSDLFVRLEAAGSLVRLDPSIEPTMYHCCTVSQPELAALRSLPHVVRMGRVRHVGVDAITLEHGAIPSDPNQLIVDCSSSALVEPPDVPVFTTDRINLLMIRLCQPTFSAALIGFVESTVSDVSEQNTLCTPVPIPMVPMDWLRMWQVTIANRLAWAQHAGVSAWLAATRLDNLSLMARTIRPGESHKTAMMQQLRAALMAAHVKSPTLLA